MNVSSGIERILARAFPKLTGRSRIPAAECAQPFVAAVLARLAGASRSWVICRDVRNQEDIAAELAAWLPETRLFPEIESPVPEALPDPEIAAERFEILRLLAARGPVGPVVIQKSQWESPVPSASALGAAVLRAIRGEELDIEETLRRLERAGYERSAQVAARGQYSLRGGILDVFSWQGAAPVRIELDDLTIASIRTFDLDSQISSGEVASCDVLAGRLDAARATLRSYAQKSDLTLGIGREDGNVLIGEADAMDLVAPPFADLGAGDLVLDAFRQEQLFRQLEQWRTAGWLVAIAAASAGELERFHELAATHRFDADSLELLRLPAARGFVFAEAGLAVLTDAELFGRSASMRRRRVALRRERLASRRSAMDFSEFEPGDLVVHLEHGIGRYAGLEPASDEGSETLLIEYAGRSRLYVPMEQAWQVSRYAGLGKRQPEPSELGDGRWERARQKAQRSVFDFATRMLRVQAERESATGFALGPDTHWQTEFEDAFPFEETIDQLAAIRDVKKDMEEERPMERLICGDVGFGKTEVAIRAVFKAVMGGKQAALMAPTTVLAQQHFQTLRERMSEYPVTIELLSRFRTPGEQKAALRGLIEGSVDVVVGTHRLVSGDVHFKNLGLLVVDEEQRFGVKHKELLKERFRQVDVMTLSATPIPRTLYLSLMGARDMSLIETPPLDRQPVETIVCAYDERIFREAIERELARGGQVYFLHNRVRTIDRLATRVRALCPSARVVVGHGQMSEHELEAVMSSFVSGAADVLVSTTIIESGLDIPNANTIIIDRADLFGLADLYQLRGRVGRSQARAYAYLMLPRDLMGAARKRVSAIRQYSELGSGFKIAMRDLEIRGAGNLLGTAQSGHIIAVGFDLYCRLLKQAVEVLKGTRRRGKAPAGLRLDFVQADEARWEQTPALAGAFISSTYVADTRTRIACYRRLAEASDSAAVTGLRQEWRDRFGPLPQPAENALVCHQIRLEAARRGVTMVEAREGKLILTRRRELLQTEGRFPRLTAQDPNSRLREVLALVETVSDS